MAKLFLSLDGQALREVQLTQPRTSIGRRANNDIQVDHLSVSGLHAIIEVVGSIYFVEDMKSTNGTRVNGEKITRHALKSGDELSIGKLQITFWRDSVAAAKQAEFENNIDETSPISAELKPAQASALTQGPVAVVRVLTGSNAGRELILNKPLTSLGKAGSNVVVFMKRENGYYISHLEGEQRPLVNSREISDQPQLLLEEDLIEVMGIRMAFFFR
ncbi:FHA domain-containing protein [Chitinibacter sp. S2-10]|uniref:FHA domain-containing protein n=1 Tax=Chitinibacter sp. S2-10 TaxID=3373597 RepID=UPI0039779F23